MAVPERNTSHSRTVLSHDADASRPAAGEYARLHTGPACPVSTSSSRPVCTLHTYTENGSSPPAITTSPASSVATHRNCTGAPGAVKVRKLR